ncbi:MAG: FtsW/RodA/SpoVE family cell cycle protein [Eubacteriales bacterium]|nr:FtsW/RodA/SpoVE family cell cycle protein [Eubacteriales bacterium]
MNKKGDADTVFSAERFLWELQRAFYSMKNSPVLAVILFEGAAFIVVHAKGAGKIYGDMIGILLLITLLGWLLNSMMHGNKKIVTGAFLLLTVGTMLQCIMKQEQLIKNPGTGQTGNPAADLQIQYLAAFAAAIVMATVYRKCPKIASMRACRILTASALSLSALTLIVAKGVGNVKNWIHIGGISLQTTEIVKLLYVFIASALLGTTKQPSPQRIRVFYGVTIAEGFFLAMQSEFGTMLLLLMVFFTYVFLFLPDIKVFFKTMAVLGVCVTIAVMAGIQLDRWREAGLFLGTNPAAGLYLSNYHKITNRFIYWMNPEKDALGLGYQLLKARESIVLGGWFGTASVTDLPVKTSDLVYPALIQRCGMVFALLIFFVYIMMWLEGIRLVIRKQDRYHQAVGAGLIFMFFDQTLIIIGGSTGLCPLTGITLPFISSGGSSLMVTFMTIGLLLAISGNIKWKGTVQNEEDEFFKENAMAAKCYAALRHFYAHLPRPNFRPAAGSLRGGGQTENEGKGKDVCQRVHKREHQRQRGKHSGGFRKTGRKKKVQ